MSGVNLNRLLAVNQQADQDSLQKGVLGSALSTTWSNTACYSYAGRLFVAAQTIAAGGYDILTVQGSSVTLTDGYNGVNGAVQQRTVKIQSLLLSAESTLAAIVPVSVIRRTTANSGGTKSQLGATPHDINDMILQNGGTNVIASAVVNVYTAISTPGTVYGASANPAANGALGQQFMVAANTGTVAPQPSQWLLEQMGVKPWILRGPNDFIAVNLAAGTVIPTGGVYIDYELDIEEDYSAGGG